MNIIVTVVRTTTQHARFRVSDIVGGDWQQLMLVQEATLAEYHQYSVEWLGGDLIFRLDGREVYRNEREGDKFPEPLFAALNFAKINNSPMTTKSWTMEVDWVKHEYWPEKFAA